MAEILRSREPMRYLRERSGVLLTMAITASALLLLPVLLTLQFAQLSNRPAESLEDALKMLYPANLATLAVADVFGTSGSYWGPGAATLPRGRVYGQFRELSVRRRFADAGAALVRHFRRPCLASGPSPHDVHSCSRVSVYARALCAAL